MTLAETEPNPLAAGLERLPVAPTNLVIFGATGDLARRKLLPAIYNLAHEGALPGQFNLIGVSRGEHSSAEYRDTAAESIRAFSRTKVDENVLERPARRAALRHRRVRRPGTYARPGAALAGARQGRRRADVARLLPLDRAGVLRRDRRARSATPAWRGRSDAEVRVIIEKPFGTSLAEARELNAKVLSVFEESQVFRIDHYLGKETVQNMLAFRFANGMFEPLWNRNYIANVQITAAEDIGIGSRAGYYDHAGALRDLVQNHMLQLLTLLCMEPPVTFAADDVRDEKVKVLHAIRTPQRRTSVAADERARAVRAGRQRRRAGRRLPAGGRRARRLAHRDLRRAAPGGRQLALGRRARSTCAPASGSRARSPRSP